jgi:hypothetical protein
LASFVEKSGGEGKKDGFEAYADAIRVAEEKLNHAWAMMDEEEKKENLPFRPSGH